MRNSLLVFNLLEISFPLVFNHIRDLNADLTVINFTVRAKRGKKYFEKRAAGEKKWTKIWLRTEAPRGVGGVPETLTKPSLSHIFLTKVGLWLITEWNKS